MCFRCGEKYHAGHQCKRQILLLEGEEETGQELTEEDDCEEKVKENNGEISIYALKGVANNKIIRVEGQIKGKCLMILIDNGSTYNFLDESTAKRLKCQLTRTPPLNVTVANSQRVMSTSTCNGFF